MLLNLEQYLKQIKLMRRYTKRNRDKDNKNEQYLRQVNDADTLEKTKPVPTIFRQIINTLKYCDVAPQQLSDVRTRLFLAKSYHYEDTLAEFRTREGYYYYRSKAFHCMSLQEAEAILRHKHKTTAVIVSEIPIPPSLIHANLLPHYKGDNLVALYRPRVTSGVRPRLIEGERVFHFRNDNLEYFKSCHCSDVSFERVKLDLFARYPNQAIDFVRYNKENHSYEYAAVTR